MIYQLAPMESSATSEQSSWLFCFRNACQMRKSSNVVLTTLLTSVTNQSTLTSSFHQSLTSNPKPILSRRPPSKLHSPDDDLQTHWPLFDLHLISNLLFHRSTCQTPNPSLLETSTKKNLRWTAPFQKFQGIGEATSLVSHSRGPKILRSNKIVPGVWVW